MKKIKRKILLVQFRKERKKATQEKNTFKKAFSSAGVEAEIVSFDALDPASFQTNVDLDKYDSVIFGGSELSFEGQNTKDERILALGLSCLLTPLVKKIVRERKPTLAICFGHQIFGSVFGAPVKKDKCRGKAGSFKVELNERGQKDPLFKGVDKEFFAAYMHQDALFGCPKQAKVLAKGERCSCAVIKYATNVYTLQFHPELNKKTLLDRLKKYPQYLNGATPEKVVKDMPEMSKILRNFTLLGAKKTGAK